MNPVTPSSRPTIRTPVRQPRARPRTDPMLAVWAVSFLFVLFGLVQGAEKIRNGWNPLGNDAQAVQSAPVPTVEEKVMHICTDAKGKEFKQEAACPEIIKTVAEKSGKSKK